ncbi:MAG TPA: SHOCT domain-containing protein [Mucilaginibacter sp.]|jgi:hypothetical protein
MDSLGAAEITLILIAFIMSIVPAVLGYKEGSKRTTGAAGGLILGFLFSFLGVLIVYCSRRIDEPFYYNFPNNSSSAADELQKFKQLLDSGAITEQEYSTQKARISDSN